MMDIFLSASVPLPERDRKFFKTADVLAIREAIKALVEVVLPQGTITCGGHPAITPLLALFVREAGLEAERVTIFQSAMFSDQLPKELSAFVDVRTVPAIGQQRNENLTAMRKEMIASREFAAAVFIGGMEGVLEELDLFGRVHPKARVLPLASTGAAAALIYKQGDFDKQFAYNMAYPSLFRRKLLLNDARSKR